MLSIEIVIVCDVFPIFFFLPVKGYNPNPRSMDTKLVYYLGLEKIGQI